MRGLPLNESIQMNFIVYNNNNNIMHVHLLINKTYVRGNIGRIRRLRHSYIIMTAASLDSITSLHHHHPSPASPHPQFPRGSGLVQSQTWWRHYDGEGLSLVSVSQFSFNFFESLKLHLGQTQSPDPEVPGGGLT